MPISNQLPEGLDEVDVIVAGGGTAGCIVAGRLAAADPNCVVLVIEGGQNNDDVLSVTHPALMELNYIEGSKTSITYTGNKSEHLAGREQVVWSGGILGSVNGSMYTRPARADYDSFNVPGWGTDEMLPYLKRFETYHGKGDPNFHGYDGPIHISRGTYHVKKVEDDLMQAAAKLGYPEYEDMQDFDSSNGFQRWYGTCGPDGKRSNSAHGYLHPLLKDGKHPNLHVLCESKVIRVLFDEKRAVGVEFTANSAYHPDEKGKVSVRARKMVILSCGSIGTTCVLERSGVGDAQVLQKAGVPLVEELPGVGRDYQDHTVFWSAYMTNLGPRETKNGLYDGLYDTIEELLTKKDAMLGWTQCDWAGKLRPTEAEVDDLGPELRAAWNRDFKDKPSKPLMLVVMMSSLVHDRDTKPPYPCISMATFSAYPYSRGHVHITGPGWDDRPDFDTGHLSDPNGVDVKTQLWAYKKMREIMRRTEMYRGEIGHPKYSSDSDAASVDLLTNPGSLPASKDGIENLRYSAEDDAAIEQQIRESVTTAWHGLGTCKMAPRDEMGVVDANLSVYGLTGLKIADLSVIPENVGANTCVTAFAVGEKAADIFARELGNNASVVRPSFAKL